MTIVPLIKHPQCILPQIKLYLDIKATDDILKYWIIIELIPKLSVKEQIELAPYISRIINKPTSSEKYEELVEEATEYQNWFKTMKK